MSNSYVLSKDHLTHLLRQVMKDYAELIAPVKGTEGDYLFARVKEPEEVYMDYTIAEVSPKKILFPITEAILAYSKDGSVEEIRDERQRVIWGLRSCDLMGIKYAEWFFGKKDMEDIYFADKFNKSIFVTLSCNEPFPDCFCSQMNSGPYLKEGFDLQLCDLEDNRYLVDVGSEKGKDFVKKYGYFFKEASEEDVKLGEAKKTGALDKFKKPVDFAYYKNNIKIAELPDSFWKVYADKCITCGGCTYVCPTCTCFNVFDQERKLGSGSGIRCRNWDSCQFAGYTRMAGGHNPRGEKFDQIKRWYFHKLYDALYEYDYKAPGCVGCGRCSMACPVGIEMTAILNDAKKLSLVEIGGGVA